MILPTYDIKKLKLHSMKPQKMMNSLNTQFQEGQEKVKTKKKLGFKKSKQKTASAPVMAFDISRLSVVDAGPRILLLPV